MPRGHTAKIWGSKPRTWQIAQGVLAGLYTHLDEQTKTMRRAGRKDSKNTGRNLHQKKRLCTRTESPCQETLIRGNSSRAMCMP